MIFKQVLDKRPYPEHDFITNEQWSQIIPCQVELADIITTKSKLDLNALLSEDSTFFGDMFVHIVKWKGEIYLESGLHRALRSALQQQHHIHARVLTLLDNGQPLLAPSLDDL